MTTRDSSVLIAGADPGHAFHTLARAALTVVRDSGTPVAHTIAEVHAVLTAPAYAYAGARVAEYLAQFLRQTPTGLDPSGYPAALQELAGAGVTYDALIALGAREGWATLISLDRRAAPTYTLVGAEFQLLNA